MHGGGGEVGQGDGGGGEGGGGEGGGAGGGEGSMNLRQGGHSSSSSFSQRWLHTQKAAGSSFTLGCGPG